MTVPPGLSAANRSIPAHAGEPSLHGHCGGPALDLTFSSRDKRVYPRACGGTTRWGSMGVPAAAGRDLRAPGHGPVYPRACGEPACRPGWISVTGGRAPKRWHSRWGLSPRMRGNRPRGHRLRRAGRPHPGEHAALLGRNHDGLSPRMRGNLVSERQWVNGLCACGGRLLAERMPVKWSIPAHAGEPMSGDVPRIVGQVYPHACGGTRATC